MRFGRRGEARRMPAATSRLMDALSREASPLVIEDDRLEAVRLGGAPGSVAAGDGESFGDGGGGGGEQLVVPANDFVASFQPLADLGGNVSVRWSDGSGLLGIPVSRLERRPHGFMEFLIVLADGFGERSRVRHRGVTFAELIDEPGHAREVRVGLVQNAPGRVPDAG